MTLKSTNQWIRIINPEIDPRVYKNLLSNNRGVSNRLKNESFHKRHWETYIFERNSNSLHARLIPDKLECKNAF